MSSKHVTPKWLLWGILVGLMTSQLALREWCSHECIHWQPCYGQQHRGERLKERKGTGLVSGVGEGTIKRDLICDPVVRGQFYSILFISWWIRIICWWQHISYTAPCVNPTNWRPSFCVDLVFMRLSLVKKPVCWPYGNSFRFCLSAQTLFRLWQRRNEFSSPPSQLVFKLPIKKQGGAVKLYRAFKGWDTDRFFLKLPRLSL
jgi:hypothetical protein